MSMFNWRVPRAHLRQDWTLHIALALAHLRLGWALPCRICTGTGLIRVISLGAAWHVSSGASSLFRCSTPVGSEALRSVPLRGKSPKRWVEDACSGNRPGGAALTAHPAQEHAWGRCT